MKKIFKNKALYFTVLLLSIMGLFYVYLSSSYSALTLFGNEKFFVIKHLIWLSVGLIGFHLVQFIPTKIIISLSKILYFICLVLLIGAVLAKNFDFLDAFFPSKLGARRWFNMPSKYFGVEFGFQPAELLKLVYSILLPSFLANIKGGKQNITKYLISFLLPVFLILMQPDFKSTLIIVAVGFSAVFFANYKIFTVLKVISPVLIIITLLLFTSTHSFRRIQTFLGTGDTNSEYHTKQIKIAVASGGINGVGIGKSIQKQDYLPEVAGDSIFAIIAEETGFLGSIFVVSLLYFLLYQIYISYKNCQDAYKKITIGCIMVWYSSQIFLNIGSMLQVIPLTGVPLPLISYGGSSLVFFLISFGLVLKYGD